MRHLPGWLYINFLQSSYVSSNFTESEKVPCVVFRLITRSHIFHKWKILVSSLCVAKSPNNCCLRSFTAFTVGTRLNLVTRKRYEQCFHVQKLNFVENWLYFLGNISLKNQISWDRLNVIKKYSENHYLIHQVLLRKVWQRKRSSESGNSGCS